MAFSLRPRSQRTNSPAKSASGVAQRGPGTSAVDPGHDDETFDVEFLAPTARLPSGIVCNPRSIPANSARLKELCPYFSTRSSFCLLSAAFTNITFTVLSEAQDNRGNRWIGDYRDVYGDSDLEDVNDCGNTEVEDWAAKYAVWSSIRSYWHI